MFHLQSYAVSFVDFARVPLNSTVAYAGQLYH